MTGSPMTARDWNKRRAQDGLRHAKTNGRGVCGAALSLERKDGIGITGKKEKPLWLVRPVRYGAYRMGVSFLFRYRIYIHTYLGRYGTYPSFLQGIYITDMHYLLYSFYLIDCQFLTSHSLISEICKFNELLDHL